MGTDAGQIGQDGRPTLVMWGLVAISGLVALSALWAMYDALATDPRVWGWFGFEVVVLVASALGVMVGLGRPREAPALGAMCVAGAIFAASTLGRFSAIVTRSDQAITPGAAFRMLPRDVFYDARLLAAIALGVFAIVLALGRDLSAWRRLVLGSVAGVPVLAASAWTLGPGKGVLLAPVETALDMARLVGSILGVIATIALTSISVHMLVGAFEARMQSIGRKTPAPTPNKPA